MNTELGRFCLLPNYPPPTQDVYLCAASLDARSTVRPPPLSVRAHHTTPCPLVTSCLPPTIWAEEATAVVSYTATVLDTPQATWASLAYAQAPDCTVVRGLRLAVELPYG